MERGFYDERRRRVRGSNPYTPQFVPLGQLCDHPAALPEWQERLGASGLDLSKQKLHTVEELRTQFIQNKRAQDMTAPLPQALLNFPAVIAIAGSFVAAPC